MHDDNGRARQSREHTAHSTHTRPHAHTQAQEEHGLTFRLAVSVARCSWLGRRGKPPIPLWLLLPWRLLLLERAPALLRVRGEIDRDDDAKEEEAPAPRRAAPYSSSVRCCDGVEEEREEDSDSPAPAPAFLLSLPTLLARLLLSLPIWRRLLLLPGEVEGSTAAATEEEEGRLLGCDDGLR